MNPQIIFEDKVLLVIDKPSGIIVNRAETTRGEETVQDWTEKKLNTKNLTLKTPKTEENQEFYNRGGIVHRLDKETSGLLLIAKTPEAFINLQVQFKNRQVKKKYIALVHGKVIPEEGEINAPVGRLPWNRERFGVMPGGKEAVTKYRRLSVFGSRLSDSSQSVDQSIGLKDRKTEKPKNQNLKTENRKPITEYSLLEIFPETGRTHQIRIHLKYLGFPIVGDTFYAGRKQANEDRKFCPRVFLHASHISFLHPTTGEKVEFNAPLPDELENVLNNF